MLDRGLFLSLILLMVATTSRSQDDWPRTITAANGSLIRISHPQPDSFIDNNLYFNAAFSFTKNNLPINGSFHAHALIETDKNNRILSLRTANIISITETDSALRNAIEAGLPSICKDLSIPSLIGLFHMIPQTRDPSTGLSHSPPRIIIANHRCVLIFIDGPPCFRWNREYALPAVANSPFTILQSSDNWWYCYGGRRWYIAPSPEGPWQHTTYIAPDLHHIATLINSINDRESQNPDTAGEGNATAPDLLCTTNLTELVRTNGGPVFTAIPGTRLRFAANTGDALLLDTLTHQYHLLIAGRWFAAGTLDGPWKYVPADSLSSDFAKIPTASPVARVLSFVPGTSAARAAIIDALIPQTSTIPRHNATTTVAWNGTPKFIPIRGTHLYYAQNAASVVIRAKHHFYCVDKGIWFISQSTKGPWIAATDRPEDIGNIPPDCPIYNCKYVYIYGFDNKSVFSGYTAGYLQSYIDGNTLVYGTGYYYPSSTDNAVCPRPRTYGFNMQYAPGIGWILGQEYSPDWFNTATAWGIGEGTGGWFGPAGYRPPYIKAQ